MTMYRLAHVRRTGHVLRRRRRPRRSRCGGRGDQTARRQGRSATGVLEGIGGFGGLFALDLKGYRNPVLVSATDGVGTKLELARQLGRHDTIGIDLVAMVVDDLVVPGAEPLFFLDYIAVGKLDPGHVEAVVAGIADGCEEAGCALVGGEMAEHPGVMPAGSYDLAGFGVGIVERDRILGPHNVQVGDDIVAMASTGLHSNGYSLARKVIEGVDLDDDHGLLVHSLGDALLRPTRIYTPHCLALARRGDVSAFCHVTGGGIPGNLPRSLPEGSARSSTPPPSRSRRSSGSSSAWGTSPRPRCGGRSTWERGCSPSPRTAHVRWSCCASSPSTPGSAVASPPKKACASRGSDSVGRRQERSRHAPETPVVLACQGRIKAG
jgi:phosphoribosylaminoimidazole synthetase